MEEIDDCMNQVYRMALAAMQSYTFWLYSRADENPYERSIKAFGHFFYATNEAHLTMTFISLDCLFDDKEKYQNFERLLVLLPSKLSKSDFESIQKRVTTLQKKAKGIGIIRNNSFGHISERKKREEIGAKYGMKNGELMGICYQALELATDISRMLGRVVPNVEEICGKDIDDIQAIFGKLEAN